MYRKPRKKDKGFPGVLIKKVTFEQRQRTWGNKLCWWWEIAFRTEERGLQRPAGASLLVCLKIPPAKPTLFLFSTKRKIVGEAGCVCVCVCVRWGFRSLVLNIYVWAVFRHPCGDVKNPVAHVNLDGGQERARIWHLRATHVLKIFKAMRLLLSAKD